MDKNAAHEMSDADFLIATTLSDLIEKTTDYDIRYKLAETRDNILCQLSGLGEYRCSVRMPFKSNSLCDACLEKELYELWRLGVHTVSSCCGHGRVPPYIQVLHGESVKKMHELGYVKIQNEACPDNPNPAYRPKTYLPCFSPCSQCAKSKKTVDGGKWECVAEDYDTEFDTFWCFVPRPPKEETE